jgi:hypothetical protein
MGKSKPLVWIVQTDQRERFVQKRRENMGSMKIESSQI